MHLPKSPETPETAVFAEPGSAHAAVSLTNDVFYVELRHG
jgi:hypothetical protein